MSEARAQLAEQREPSKPEPGRPPTQLQPGDRVRLATLGSEGEVVSVKGEKVVVQLGTVRTTVAMADLRPTKEPERARTKVKSQAAAPMKQWDSSEAAKHFGAEAVAVVPGVDNSVDVRGERAEDALRMMELLLDEAMRRDREVVVIIHGHGSGALKKAVREQLGALGFVRKLRPGLAAEGGDGVTVAWLGL